MKILSFLILSMNISTSLFSQQHSSFHFEKHTNNGSNEYEELTLQFNETDKVSSKLINSQRFSSSNSQLIDSVITDHGDGQRWIESQEKHEYTHDLNENLSSYSHFIKDVDTDEWVGDYRNEYGYNSLDQLTDFLKKIWDPINKVWVVQFKSERTYDNNENEISYTKYDWDLSQNDWVGNRKTEEGFDELNNPTLHATYLWNVDLNRWDGQNKTTWNFDADSRMTSYGFHNWDQSIGEWFTFFKYEYSHQGIFGLGLGYNWDDMVNDWQLSNKEELEYNENNQIISSSEYYYQKFDNVWKPLSKYEYSSYDNQGRAQQSVSYRPDNNGNWIFSRKNEVIWNGEDIDFSANYQWDELLNLWIGDHKYERIRNSENTQISFTSYGWDYTSNEWKAINKNESELNEEGNYGVLTYYKWNADNHEWDNHVNRKYYYKEVITALTERDLSVLGNEFSIFPNPATDQITFDLGASMGNAHWSIMSSKGSMVQTGDFNYSNAVITLNSLNPGIYLVIVQTENKVIKGSFIKN